MHCATVNYCEIHTHTHTQTQLAELEGEGSRLRSLLRHKEQEVERVGEVASKLTKERDNVADIVRQEFADRYGGCENTSYFL